MDRNSPDPLEPHSHEPNPNPPSDDPTFFLNLSNGLAVQIDVRSLHDLSRTTLSNCIIVSTDHGTSGPFSFSGVTLSHLISANIPKESDWDLVEVIGGDGFGTRILKEELLNHRPAKPIILADSVDSRPMTREQGLIRLIVPGETDDALRQVKWISKIILRSKI